MLDTFRFSERFLSFKSQISLLWTETVTTGQFMFGCPCFECGACNIWSALTEIKYTLHVSILQVYLYMCFSGEKSIRSIIHLQFKTSIKLIEYINGKCISLFYTSYNKVYFKYTSSNFSAGEKIFPKKSVLYYKYT